MDIANVIKSRFSSRNFLDKDVPEDIITNMLDAARYAPSGVNTQPWHVIVLKNDKLKKVSELMLDKFDNHSLGKPEYDYYPTQWFEPYSIRRKNCRLSRFAALGITKHDTQTREQAWRRNYEFFGAPVGLIFLKDKRLGEGSFLDYGMFLQNIMLMATAQNLATCAQAAIAEYHQEIREYFNIDNNLIVVCGMALGYPDHSKPGNSYRLPREQLDSFVNWQV